MAATYTASLRLTLLADGDANSTWGSTLNTGVFSLVEASVAGMATVAMPDANYTLTANNGVADEARQAILKFTGAITASRNVIVPTASKVYIVENATTGGYGLVIKTAAGTGVTIASGVKSLLICDGTNVISAINSVPNATFDSITVSNSTFTGTNAFSGTITAPTQPYGTNDTTVCTMAALQAGLVGISLATDAMALTVSNSSAVTLSASQQDATTYSGVCTWTLPASPSAGTRCSVIVANGRVDNVIDRNTQNIMGIAENMTVDNEYATITLRYINSSYGWAVI